MLDKNVGDALLKLDLSPQTDPPSAQVERIIDADRRRVKRWTRIAVALWILAALGAILIFVMGGFTFPLIAKMIKQENDVKTTSQPADAAASAHAKDAKPPQGTLQEPNTSFLLLAKLTAMCMVFGTTSFMLLVFAGLATVVAPSLADGNVQADQRQPAADFRTA